MTIPDESDLVFNVVWTGTTFTHLRSFAASQLAHTRARFRWIANECPPEQVALMEEVAALHGGQVVEVLDISPDEMVPHGVALDRVRAVRDDGAWFCLIDPDIKANGPFVDTFLELLREYDAVSSATEVWSDHNVLPEEFWGVAGEYFYDSNGFVFGGPHLTLYRRAALEDTVARWGQGIGANGNALPPATRAKLDEMGFARLRAFDTGKLVNILLQADGYRLVHQDLPQLVHIGGLAHFLHPPAHTTDESGDEVPDWAIYEHMATRFVVARHTARVLTALTEGGELPDLPPDLAPADLERLRFVQDEVVDMVARYGPS